MSYIAAGGLLVAGGSAIAGGLMSSSGAKKQAQAMREAIAYQKEKDIATQARFEPYQGLGKESINQFQAWRDDPTKDPNAYLDPGYEFRLEQGNKGIASNAATSGMLQSGDTLRALTEYGQDASSQEYNNAFNRWMGEGKFKADMVGMGQNAAAQESGLLNQGAANVGNITANADFGASDQILGDTVAGAGGMFGNAFTKYMAGRRPATTPTTPGGSNVFDMTPRGGYV